MGRQPAHPRSRGENEVDSLLGVQPYGSSPLTRGKLRSAATARMSAGLIPAHAGKTRGTGHYRPAPAAHPRSRGENCAPGDWVCQRSGSSPLTRGKPVRAEAIAGDAGLIPAHAGKTPRVLSQSSGRGAHPRSRGENKGEFKFRDEFEGSSPLTRGKPSFVMHISSISRLIPAHAGKTASDRPFLACFPAHPRSRGENENAKRRVLIKHGSSPLTRGKLGHFLVFLCERGLIPAHAGKTVFGAYGYASVRAHPRSRGENKTQCRRWACRGGSSPLTRGKRKIMTAKIKGTGLIPAHAGKTTR